MRHLLRLTSREMEPVFKASGHEKASVEERVR